MKFVMLMREKADLLEMLDVNKLLLANFSMEEEIVGMQRGMKEMGGERE